MKIAILVPTYNESDNIAKLLPALAAVSRRIPDADFRALVIDDSSPDGTADAARKLSNDLHSERSATDVLVRREKQGLGKAYIHGFKTVLGLKDGPDYVLRMDADLSHDPRYIDDFLACAGGGADFIVGARYMEGGSAPDWSWYRKLLSRGVYFYNGDSLTLALLWKSLRAGEPFHWVLSSQLFLFPEGLLYAVSALIAPTIRASFLVNSAIAVALLYTRYWLLGRLFFETRRASHAFSLLAVGIILLYMWCETAPNINGKAFVTLYLFNTYYYGVILCGLLVLYWAAWIVLRTNDSGYRAKHIAAPLAGIFAVTALTYFSDPLFFLRCSAPLLAAVFILRCARLLRGWAAILLMASQLAGIALGSAGRGLCKAYLGNPVTQYLDFGNVMAAARLVGKTMSEVAHTPVAMFEFGLMALGMLAALFAIAWVWRQRPRDRSCSATGPWAAAALIALFAAGSPISSVSGAMLTGNA